MNRSLWRSLAALAVLCLLPLTACQTRAGAAAFVGGTRISSERVQDLTAEGLRNPVIRGGVTDVSAYRGVVLSRLIKHELIARAAAEAGVSVSDGEVTQVITAERGRAGGAQQLAKAAAAAPLGLPESQLETFYRDLILLDKIGAELTKDLTFTEAELKDFYDRNGGSAVGPYEAIKPRVVEAVRRQRAGAETAKFIKDFLSRVRVKVSPRYGRFDASKFLDPEQGPVLAPAPDKFFRGQPSVVPTPSAGAPTP